MIRHSKFDWDCSLVEFTVDNLKVLTFNWDCTLVKSENSNKLIKTLHGLICKSITVLYGFGYQNDLVSKLVSN